MCKQSATWPTCDFILLLPILFQTFGPSMVRNVSIGPSLAFDNTLARAAQIYILIQKSSFNKGAMSNCAVSVSLKRRASSSCVRRFVASIPANRQPWSHCSNEFMVAAGAPKSSVSPCHRLCDIAGLLRASSRNWRRLSWAEPHHDRR